MKISETISGGDLIGTVREALRHALEERPELAHAANVPDYLEALARAVAVTVGELVIAPEDSLFLVTAEERTLGEPLAIARDWRGMQPRDAAEEFIDEASANRLRPVTPAQRAAIERIEASEREASDKAHRAAVAEIDAHEVDALRAVFKAADRWMNTPRTLAFDDASRNLTAAIIAAHNISRDLG